MTKLRDGNQNRNCQGLVMGKGIFAEAEQLCISFFTWLHDLQGLSLSGIEPGPQNWKLWVLTTGPPGNFQQFCLLILVTATQTSTCDKTVYNYTHKHACTYIHSHTHTSACETGKTAKKVYEKYPCQFSGFNTVLYFCKMLSLGKTGERLHRTFGYYGCCFLWIWNYFKIKTWKKKQIDRAYWSSVP